MKQDFHAYTTRYAGLSLAIITEIKVTQAFEPSESILPPSNVFSGKALWDTGATKSVITQSVVKKLSLIPTGATLINHAGGQSQSLTYMVNVFLPNNVGVTGVLVSEMNDTNNFDLLIGMDIICQGDFAITNVKGQTCMSFRTPSIQTIDYVVEANKIVFAGQGRNEPCRCGSGKKFKVCHGK